MLRSHVLMLDHDANFRALARAALPGEHFVLTPVDAGGALRARLEAEPEPHALLLDVQLPGVDSAALCAEILAIRPELPVILVTNEQQISTAVAAIRAGAFDILHEPFSAETLRIAVDRAVAHRTLRREVRRLRREAAGIQFDADLAGTSEPMQRLLRLLPKVATSDASVLVTGESGTGKELVARALHLRSRRRDSPFVAINCAAMPEALLESELFGHVRGAFTDAKGARAGLIARAHRGTLFLDEIGDMPLGVQAKLLRVLQERKLRPVGADDEIAVDVRVLAATHRDLDAAADAGRFRSDLLYRLDVVRLELPPLRERGDDVLLLAERFLAEQARRLNKPIVGLSEPVRAALRAWSWPGNVRELHNCIERAVVLADHDHLVLDDLPRKVAAAVPTPPAGSAPPSADGPIAPLDAVERAHVLRALRVFGGNRTLAARALGLDRKTLYRKLVKWGEVPDDD